MMIILLTTSKVVIIFFGDIYYLSFSFSFFFFFKFLTSKYCASCTLALPVSTHSKISPNSKIKIIPYHFLKFFFFNQVGVIEIFLVCLVGELFLSGRRVSNVQDTLNPSTEGRGDVEDPNQTMTQLTINSRTL